MKVKFEKCRENAHAPCYGTEFSAGADLYACLSEDITIQPHETFLIPTGLKVEIPEGYAGLIYARSGIATKRGLAPANCVGVVDSDYRGEVMVALHNYGNKPQTVACSERVAQLVITPFLKADFEEGEVNSTVRGEGGFGSTGKK